MEAEIVCKEIFGLALPIAGVRDVEEALDTASAQRYGLDSCVLTNNFYKMWYFAKRLRAGSITVNDVPRHGVGCSKSLELIGYVKRRDRTTCEKAITKLAEKYYMPEAYQLFSFHDRLGENLGKPLIVGFPDTGLAGAISVSYVVDKLELEEVGYIDSSELPPILPVRRMEPKELIRIYDSRNFLTIVSEIPIPPTLIRPFASDLLDWAERKGVSGVVCLTGIAEPKRLELETPAVFMVSSKPQEVEKAAKRLECEVLSEGFITGIHAEILRLGMRRGLDVYILLAQSHLNYPDPGAAAQLLNKLSRLVNEKIDVKPLLESEEMVRLQLRDLMRRTAEAMVQKSREMELPPVYR